MQTKSLTYYDVSRGTRWFARRSTDKQDNRVEPMDHVVDVSIQESIRKRDIEGHIDETKIPPDLFKRAGATAALAAGGIATIAWTLFLGWAVTEAIAN